MFYHILADIVTIAHFAFVGFVVIGLLLILVGAAFRWGWIRNFWFRLAHTLAILVVVLETVVGMTCILTDWEYDLRKKAGQETGMNPNDGFVHYWVHRIMFFDTQAEGGVSQEFLNGCYYAVAGVILATYVLIPPRLPKRRKREASALPRLPATGAGTS
jgi:hypothetical protein